MNNHYVLLGAVALAAVLPSQNMTSPPGYLGAEGAGSYVDVAGGMAGMYTHYVHVDDSLRQQGAHSIRKLYLRRDGQAATNAAYSARPLAVEVRMALADFRKVINGGGVEDNVLRLTPWQTVFADRPVSFPSFVNKPATAPAPWSIALTLDTPYAYQPTGAFAVHIRVAPSATMPPSNYPFDASGEEGAAQPSLEAISQGCALNGNGIQLSGFVANYGDPRTKSFLGAYLSRGVPSTPWVLGLGVSDSNFQFGGCDALRTSADVVLPQSPTDATGFGSFGVEFGHHASLVGRTFYLQTAQPWAGHAVPIAFSNGSKVTYPANPVLPSHAVSLSWSPANTFGTGHFFYRAGAMILGLDW